MRRLCGPDLLLIGVGGVDSAERAQKMIQAGADLIQIYTGLVYQGPSLVGTLSRAAAYRRFVR